MKSRNILLVILTYFTLHSTTTTTTFLTLMFFSSIVNGQEYTDYANDYVQDTLYQDYAKRQHEKDIGAAGNVGGGGGG